MRNNQPVNNQEYCVADDAAIISRTDSQGIITHVNDDFIAASGFDYDDLIGQPHNIVRHPDMPSEAYRDLWQTIQVGRPWVGIVKNRRKNGGYYWVKSTITPTDSGFMSVRVKATSVEIRNAEALYVLMRRDAGIRLEEGHLLPAMPGRLLQKLRNLKLSTRLWLSTFASMAVVLLCLGLGLQATELAQADLLAAGAAKSVKIVEVDSWLRLIGGLTLVLWPLLAWLIIRENQRPLNVAIAAAKRIASMDLREPVPCGGKDEMGQLLAQFSIMQNQLRENVALLKQSSSSMDSMAGRLAESSEATSRSANDQSNLASSMAAAVEELSVSIDQVTDSATEAERISHTSEDASHSGCSVIQSAASEMGKLATAFNASALAIQELEAYSKDISAIVSVIRDIAEQTNLLALNAAIEAARAGEQGRGFAVVADEVRKLAERTAVSTKQIAEMITKVQSSSRHAFEEMTSSVNQVSLGVELANQAEASIVSIRDNSKLVQGSVNDISFAIREQAVAAREIAQSVERVAQMTEESSLASQSCASLAIQVTSLSGQIRRLASIFKV